MPIKSTIERVQGGYEVFAGQGYNLGEYGKHSHLCHTLKEAAIVAEKVQPCACRECEEDELEQARR